MQDGQRGVDKMKKCLIQISCIILFLCNCSIAAYAASFEEMWKGKAEHAISKLLSIDLNKNGINVILFHSGNKKVGIIEWNKNTFVNRWQSPEFKKGSDLLFFDSQDLLIIKKYNDHIKLFTLYELLYKDGEYLLKEFEGISIPFLQSEKYITSGSFKKKSSKDVIVTTNIITYGMKPEGYLFLEESRAPYKLLWTSPFKIFNYGTVPLFGDFDNDKKMELLVILYRETKGYWISTKENGFEVKEIKSHRKSKYSTTLDLFPLYTSNPGKYLKAGRTIDRNFDEIFFIDTLDPYDFGGLFKAVWHKDRFEFQMLLRAEKLATSKGAIGYGDLNLADIDNDGLDEITVSEIRGDIKETEEEPVIVNRRDVIHILKWNGKEYKNIWTSKSLGAITQILVDDVTGDGKKEIMVGNEKGEIHIFGQK